MVPVLEAVAVVFLAYHPNGFFLTTGNTFFFKAKARQKKDTLEFALYNQATFDLTSGLVSRISLDSVKLQSKSLLVARTR